MIVSVQCSLGELFDKYTILLIKQEKILEPIEKVQAIENELACVKSVIDTLQYDVSLLEELKEINCELWLIEDRIRIKEKLGEFDEEFIQLARSVYITNDRRYLAKVAVQKSTVGSNDGLLEIKSYCN